VTQPVPRRKPLILAAQLVLAAVVLWLAWRALEPDLGSLGGAWKHVELRALPLAISGMLVMMSYAVLILTWCLVVTAWGSRISVRAAARIWFVSNLGRYVPGKVWAIAAMGTLAQRAGVSPSVAVGSALYINAINVLAGFAVCLLAAPAATPAPPALAIPVGVAAAALVLIPNALPAVVRWVAARAGREVTLAPLRYSAIATTFGACVAAWVFYGVAFQFLAIGTIGDPSGATLDYVAVFTGSYLIGFLAVFAPGGAVVREATMITQASQLALMPAADVALLAVISRVWLTLFELLPGLLFLLISPTPTTSSPDEARTA
jgi:hypothetical protein